MRDTNSLTTLHQCSPLGILTDTDLFSLPLTQVSHKSSEYSGYFPVTHGEVTSGESIEFVIPGSETYVDPSNIWLYTRGKIVPADDDAAKAEAGTSTAATAHDKHVTTIDAFGMTQFAQVDVYLQDVKVSNNERYDMRSYYALTTKTNYPMQRYLYWPALFDTHNEDKVDFDNADKTKVNERFNLTKDSQEFETYHQLMTDLTFSDRLLLPFTTLRIVFRHNPDSVRLLTHPDNKKTFKYVLTKAKLYVRRVDIAPHVQVAHDKLLSQGKKALYMVPGIESKTRPIAAATSDVLIENVQGTRLPSVITFLFVKTSALQGDFHKSPLLSEHLNIKQAVLTVGTKQIRQTFDFDKGLVARPYVGMLQAIQNPELCMGFEAYVKRFFHLRFVLNPDCSLQHLSPLTNDNIRLELELSKPTSEAYSCIILLQTPRVIEIDKNRQVTVK
jgi:hypothetical protein